MNGTKHTLGPWRWNDERRLLQARYQESSALLDFVLCIDYSGHRPSVADARLIAAAPRLAEELSDLAKHLETYDPQGDVQAWLRSLLDYHLPQARAALREAGVES